MRKLRLIEHISMDGVIETSGGPGEDGDLPYGDWTTPYRSPAGLTKVLAMYGERFDLLLGRRTYDLLGSFCLKAPKRSMADRLNAATKYVVTSSRCKEEGIEKGTGVRSNSALPVLGFDHLWPTSKRRRQRSRRFFPSRFSNSG